MASYSIATLGAFAFDGANGASILGDIVVGPVPKTLVVASNAICSGPVDVLDYVSGFGDISFKAKLSGIETISESAPNHLQRMWSNLQAEIEKRTNTFTIAVWGMASPYVYHVHRNDDFAKTITALTQSRSVMKFDVVLKYLP